MKRISLLLILSFFVLTIHAQDFSPEKFNRRKEYILLTNPTVDNIKTIRYLVSHKILDINQSNVLFIGVYYAGQTYDFKKTADYIANEGISNLTLYKVTGNLNDKNLFGENDCVDQMKKLFQISSGTFFFGGPDIPPAVYGEENTASEVTDPGRHYFETTFLFHLLGGYNDENYSPWLVQKPRYLVTGFCLGMQTMNVATGGTLIQDIPSEVYHAKDPASILETGRNNLHRNYWQEIVKDTLLMGINLHKIQFSENPFFGKTVRIAKGWEPRILSSHHQAVEKIGKGLEVTAWSMDNKIVEGLAHRDYPNVFAVQFHPEVPALYEDMYKRKFHPDDDPKTYNDIIGNQSVKFHKLYWKHISDVIKSLK